MHRGLAIVWSVYKVPTELVPASQSFFDQLPVTSPDGIQQQAYTLVSSIEFNNLADPQNILL